PSSRRRRNSVRADASGGRSGDVRRSVTRCVHLSRDAARCVGAGGVTQRAAMVPAFGWAFACKPNAGLPVVTTYSSARAVVTCLAAATAMLALAFVLR